MLNNRTFIVPLAVRSEKKVHSNTPKENEPAAAAATLSELLKAKKEHSFPTKVLWWLNEQIPLVEAFLLQLAYMSLHFR